MLFYNPEYGCKEMVPVLRRRFLNGYEVMKDLNVRMQEARNEMPNYGELYGGGDSLYWFMSYDAVSYTHLDVYKRQSDIRGR